MDVQIKRSVLALRINFFFLGVLVAGWSTRIPELKTALNLTNAQLGRCLIGSALGAFLSSRIIGKLIKDLGTKKTFILGSCLFPLGYLTIAFGPSGFFVFLGCFFFSIGYLFMDNPMTIITQEIEAIEDRKYLSGFHGFWSIGTLFAGFFGSFLIGHVKYSYHLTGLAVISFTVLMLSSRSLAEKKVDDEATKKAKFVWKSPVGFATAILGFGMLCSISSEFGATDWSALYLRDVLRITGQLYVGAYLAFELGMVLSRLLGDKFIHKYGASKVVAFCGLTGSIAWLIGVIIGENLHDTNRLIAYGAVLFGYFCAGAGVGPLFPGLITVLGQVKGIDMSMALSRALLISMAGFAGVPALIGIISDATSLTTAMLLPIALLFTAGLIGRVRR
jgi:fucose permease